MASEVQNLDDLQLDTNTLFKEETFTDLKVGTIRRLTPVTLDGSPDAGREAVFIAQTQIMSNMGPLPVQYEIDASNMAEAIQGYPAAIKAGIDQLMDDAKELQRREMSKIVTPDAATTSKIITGK